MNHLARSGDILSAGLRVCRKNPKLLLFPLLTAAAFLLLTASFVAPVIVACSHTSTPAIQVLRPWCDKLVVYKSVRAHSRASGEGSDLTPLGYAVAIGGLAAGYFLTFFIELFSGVAMTHATLRILRGEEATVRGSMAFAWSRASAILGYTALATTVGMLLQVLSSRVRLGGKIAVALGGVAWNLAAFLVVPVIAQEKQGGWASFKRSAALFKGTWGEALIGNVTLSFLWLGISLALCVAVTVPLYFLALHFVAGSWMLALLIASFVGIGVTAFLVQLGVRVTDVVFRSALYVYAAEGVVPAEFQGPEFDAVWKVR